MNEDKDSSNVVKFINFKCNDETKEDELPIYEVKVNLALITNSNTIFEDELYKAIMTLFNNKICVEGRPSEVSYLEFIEATVKEAKGIVIS